jgi:tetratricopeptide (TPR) repeat protein
MTTTTNNKFVTTLKNARNWNTPQRYKAFQYAIWGLSGAMLVTVISAVGHQRAATQQIGRDSAGSVLMAERWKDTVAGMDSFTANELLTTPGSPQAQEAIKGYGDRYKAYVERLTFLTENITYEDAERKPIIEVQEKMGEYIRLLQKTRDFQFQSGKQAEMLATYREATTLLDKEILPKIDELSRVNHEQMKKQIDRNSAAASLFGVVLVGGLLIGALVGLQLFLVQRTKRQFNQPLLVATAIAGIFLLHSAISLSRAAGSLKVASEDAFPSLYSIRKARALSYQANSDESRYLLDKVNAATHEENFKAKVKEIMYIPRDLKLEDIARKITSNSKAELNRVKGLVAGAVSNVTFEGEGPALVESLRAWQNYVDVDDKIRQKERAGDHQGAINICLGESDVAYEKFKKALEKVQKINEDEMKNSLEKSDRALAYFEVQAAIALLLVAILTQYGLKPRIKEYQ